MYKRPRSRWKDTTSCSESHIPPYRDVYSTSWLILAYDVRLFTWERDVHMCTLCWKKTNVMFWIAYRTLQRRVFNELTDFGICQNKACHSYMTVCHGTRRSVHDDTYMNQPCQKKKHCLTDCERTSMKVSIQMGESYVCDIINALRHICHTCDMGESYMSCVRHARVVCAWLHAHMEIRHIARGSK